MLLCSFKARIRKTFCEGDVCMNENETVLKIDLLFSSFSCPKGWLGDRCDIIDLSAHKQKNNAVSKGGYSQIYCVTQIL